MKRVEKREAVALESDHTRPPEDLVGSKVNSRPNTSASEVAQEDLRLMQEQDLVRAAKFDEQRSEVRRGLGSGPGKEWDAVDLKARARIASSRLI